MYVVVAILAVVTLGFTSCEKSDDLNVNEIEVHCFGKEIDTTFMLDYYEHNDSVMVCLTGSDFEFMYGHMLGEGHMGGGMMNDIQNDG